MLHALRLASIQDVYSAAALDEYSVTLEFRRATSKFENLIVDDM